MVNVDISNVNSGINLFLSNLTRKFLICKLFAEALVGLLLGRKAMLPVATDGGVSV